MSTMFRAEKSDFARDSDDPAGSKSSRQVEVEDSSEVPFVRVEEQVASDIESFGAGIGFFHAQGELGLGNSHHQNYQQQQHVKEFGNLADLYPYVVSPPLQLCEDEMRKIIGIEAQNTELTEPKKSRFFSFPPASFELLREYRSRHTKLNGELLNAGYKIQSSHAGGPTLPTETTIKYGAQKFVQSMSENTNELSMLNHPYPSSILAHSEEDSKGVVLVQHLLSCAEKVAEMQYECAIKFLKECDKLSSCTGTPIQRLVFYFSEALFEKIARETGRIIPKCLGKPEDTLQLLMTPNMQIAFQKDFPPAWITKLVGIQAILDILGEARNVHMIDLKIRNGVQWKILMQALAARSENLPIQHLKITAIGTKSKLIQLQDTGKQLASFAQPLSFKFTFKVVLVEDILELNQNLFDLDADESVAVFASHFLNTMIGRVDRLNHLMIVMRNLNPCVMVVVELEFNCNSPSFIGRFVESLFFSGVFFDSLADWFEKDHTSRINAESALFRLSIKNILASEGEERTIRHVTINVWRAFFARLGLVEIELSTSSLDQASLKLQNFPCGRSFALNSDGKCLTIGWKGTPLKSISAWKFQ